MLASLFYSNQWWHSIHVHVLPPSPFRTNINPNVRSMKKITDLYAEVIGILSLHILGNPFQPPQVLGILSATQVDNFVRCNHCKVSPLLGIESREIVDYTTVNLQAYPTGVCHFLPWVKLWEDQACHSCPPGGDPLPRGSCHHWTWRPQSLS